MPPATRISNSATRRGRDAPSDNLRAALYARVSTNDQTTEDQLVALRAFASARGWAPVEFVDHGVSGTKDRPPCGLLRTSLVIQ